jgi:hypothetical protein
MFHGDFIGTDTAHPQCPLLDAGPLIRSLSVCSFRSRHLPLPSDTLAIASSVPDPPKVCKESGNVSQFGLPNYVKYVTVHSQRTMAKKANASNKKKRIITNVSPVDKQLDLIGHQIVQRNYAEAVTTCERLLKYLPQHAPQRADVLAQLGTAQGMLQNFPQSYEAFTLALALEPKNAELWYNRSMASRFTMRFGQALRDIERAIELNTRSELTEQFDEALRH